jgi:hypothetical protein
MLNSAAATVCVNAPLLAAHGRNGDGLAKRGEALSRRRSGFGSELTDTTPGPERKRRAPVVTRRRPKCSSKRSAHCENALVLAARCRDGDGLSKIGEELSRRRSGFGSELTDTTPGPERKRRAPVVTRRRPKCSSKRSAHCENTLVLAARCRDGDGLARR